jgi:2-polyprenyl-3-methyl-5-hydroxy-6-metoxy-1,4-benzoquinol methylase
MLAVVKVLWLQELTADFGAIQCCGVDVSYKAIELARKRMPNGRFWRLDVTRGAVDQKYDLVVCSEVLQHDSR